MVEVRWGSATDVGRIRKVNEDSLLACPPIFLVADGMGGYAAGDVASRIVVEEFSTTLDSSTLTAQWVFDRFAVADARIRAGGGGGTTVAGIAAIEQNSVPYWLVFNIGDSRVYLRENGDMRQVSVDHSVVQELLDSGELDSVAALSHPQRHVITRAVGAPELPDPDFWLIPIREGDRILLCSDGLSGEVSSARVKELIEDALPPQMVADKLVEQALEAGGRDNVTAVVIDVIKVRSDSRSQSLDVGSGTQSGAETDDEATLPRGGWLPVGGAR